MNGKTAYFYDSLNGGFAFNMGELVKDYKPSKSVNNNFATKISNSHFRKKINDDGFGFITRNDPTTVNDNLLTFLPITKKNTTFVGNNINIQNAMSFVERSNETISGIDSDNRFSIPFMNSSEQGLSAGNIIKLNEGVLTFGLFDGETKDYEIETNGLFISYSKDSENSNTSFFVGTTKEIDGFLETSISGAFAENSFANTNYIGSSSFGWLNSDWSYNSMFTLGSTNFDVDRIGLLENISDLKSSLFALEVSKSLTNRKSIHFGIYQPLRIESGNASIFIPKLYDTNGDLNFEKTSFNSRFINYF